MSACELVVLTMKQDDRTLVQGCAATLRWLSAVIRQLGSAALVQSLIVSGFLPHKENVDYNLNPVCANGNDQVLPLDPF